MSSRIRPPEFFLRFFRWYCRRSLRDAIEGDLMEMYQERLRARGQAYARRRFAWDVVLLFRPAIIRSFKGQNQLNTFDMLRSYFTIGWRNILKNKTFTGINVVGLAIGLAACLLIFQFVIYQLSFDRFNSKLDRTYRITNDRFQNGKLIQHGTITYPTIGPAMAKDYPEIELYTRLMPGGEVDARIGDETFRDDHFLFVDEYFLEVFDFPLIAGDRKDLLKDPFTVVLTKETARKYFDVQHNDYGSVIGKTFLSGLETQPQEVRAVIEDIPENSHIQFDALFSYATLIGYTIQADNSWVWSDMRHYLVLKPEADYKALESKFPEFSERYFKGATVSGSEEKFFLQPLRDAHLYSDYEYDIAKTASGRAVWSMLIVAVFILLIAWINYVNLSTSRSMDRAKEVGVRKVMGALKGELVRQFLLESVLITLFAVVVALALVSLLQASFNEIVGSQLTWRTVFDNLRWEQFLITLSILLGGAIMAGLYPAFVLSRYMPVAVLKGKFTRSSRGNYMRKALVLVQFTASAALITGTLIVGKQIEYMNKSDLGINLNNVVAIQSPDLTAWDSTFIGRVQSFKSEVAKLTGVKSVTTSHRLPGDRLSRAFDLRVRGSSSEDQFTVSHMGIDYDFFETMDVKLLAGRTFVPTDHNADFELIKSIIINENAMKLFGFDQPADAVGEEILWGTNQPREYTIVGVVSDYHQESLQKPMEPMVFRPAYSTYAPISVRMEEGKSAQLLPVLEKTYRALFPGNGFDYTFLDTRYDQQYRDDRRFSKVVTIFTVLAIIVACLGLVGLSSYTAMTRMREIGIRKVFGASVSHIVSLLSVDFVRLVMVACLLSVPLAYFGMSQWLEGYTYRINLSWLLFLLPIVLILTIALLTIGLQILGAALSKPVDTLKYE